jgi:hypothetical protein
VGLAVGTVFALKTASKNTEADSICPTGTPCGPDDVNRYYGAVDEARNARTTMIVAGGIGAASLAAGAILALTAPRNSSAAVGWTPLVGHGMAGATIHGVW